MSGDIAEQTAPYEYVKDPIVINTERPNLSKPNKLSHRLRNPTLDQWLVWGHEVSDERRNLSPEEIAEENKRSDDDDPVQWAYERRFNWYDASRRLYKAIAIDVTQYKPDERGDLQPAETHPITEELLGKAVLNPDVVISGLFKSHFELAETSDSYGLDQTHVRQTIGPDASPTAVLHIFRKATEEEQQSFKSDSLRTYIVPDKPDTYRICLNLRVANDLYNEMILRVENATVNGRVYDDPTRTEFLGAINPVFKFMALDVALQTQLIDFARVW